MSGPDERRIEVDGAPCRVWEKGTGAALGVFAGYGGLPRRTPFLEKLSVRRRVVVPSLPGHPGGPGHDRLDSQLDWVVAALGTIEAAGLQGADLIGISIGGALAAEVAAISPGLVRKLVLIAPFGLFDPADPVCDIWTQPPGRLPELLCAEPETYTRLHELPDQTEPIEWQIVQVRASEAAARLLWPICDTRLDRRLGRIGQPTLLVWGDGDQVVPVSYAERFAAGIAGETTIKTIPGAGHLADLDAPDAVSDAVLGFLD